MVDDFILLELKFEHTHFLLWMMEESEEPVSSRLK